MNNKIKILTVAVCTFAFCGTTFAAPPRHHNDENDGLRLATGIVQLVQSVVAPRPVVINQPAPVVVNPAPPPVPAPQRPVMVQPAPAPQRPVMTPPAAPAHRPGMTPPAAPAHRPGMAQPAPHVPQRGRR